MVWAGGPKTFFGRTLDKRATRGETTNRDRSGPSRLRVVTTPGGNRKYNEPGAGLGRNGHKVQAPRPKSV